MATQVWRDAYLWINGVDYSADIAELGLNYASEVLDATHMGDTTRRRKGGLFTWEVTAKAHQDFSSAHVGANLFALVGTSVCVEIRPTNTCSTAINPSFSGVGMLVNAPPVAGAVGSLLDMSFTMQSVSALSRASSS